MKYRQICVLGALGVISNSITYQVNAIKLDETTDKKSYMEVELDAEESS